MRTTLLFLTLLFFLPTSFQANAAEQAVGSVNNAANLDLIQRFLSENAVNRTLSFAKDGRLAGGTVAYEFRRDMTICNLVRISESSLSFDLFYSIKQRNWDMNEGERSSDPRIEDRMLVQRINITALKSTGEVIGHARTISSTRKEWAAYVQTVKMRVEGNSLNLFRSSAGYTDFFGPGGEYYPGMDEVEESWSVEGGRLKIVTKGKTYRVQTDEQRELLNEYSFEEKETARLPLKR